MIKNLEDFKKLFIYLKTRNAENQFGKITRGAALVVSKSIDTMRDNLSQPQNQ